MVTATRPIKSLRRLDDDDQAEFSPDEPRHELAIVERVSLDRHPVAVYLARLAPSSRRTMRAALDAIARLLIDERCDASSLDWTQLRYRHTTAVRALLADGRYAPSTANRHLAALRGVLKECWRLGYVSAEDFSRAADLEPVRGSRLPRGRALQPGEVRALFAACADVESDKKPAMAARDAAILALLYGSGLRRAEAVGLEVADYDRDAGTLKVRGKGNKERLAHLGDASQAAQEAWLSIRGFWMGPLFVAINKGGGLGKVGMSGQAMLYIARQRTVQASVAAFSPHDLRRAHSPAICWTRAPTSVPFNSSPAMPRSRPPHATTVAARPPRSARPSSFTCRIAASRTS